MQCPKKMFFVQFDTAVIVLYNKLPDFCDDDGRRARKFDDIPPMRIVAATQLVHDIFHNHVEWDQQVLGGQPHPCWLSDRILDGQFRETMLEDLKCGLFVHDYCFSLMNFLFIVLNFMFFILSHHSIPWSYFVPLGSQLSTTCFWLLAIHF